MTLRFALPDVGEGLHEAEIVRWLVAAGDVVRRDQPLVEILTDKAQVELPSPAAGVIRAVSVAEGDIVAVGAVIVEIDEIDEIDEIEKTTTQSASISALRGSRSVDSQVGGAPAALSERIDTESTPRTVLNGMVTEGDGVRRPKASPSTRRLAAGLGVDLGSITGTGPGGRILATDVENSAAGAAPPRRIDVDSTQWSDAPPPAVVGESGFKAGAGLGQHPFGTHPLRGIRRLTAASMTQSWSKIPHITGMDEVDATALLDARHRLRERLRADGAEATANALTPLVLLAAIVSRALRRYPLINAGVSDDGTSVTVYDHVNLGLAVATTGGLIVPVITDADRRNLSELATDIQRLATAARSRTISAGELRGATFTITNYGALGGRFASPLVLPGQAGIMGFGAIRERPIAIDGAVLARPTLPVVFSADHRVIDGDLSVAFQESVLGAVRDPLTLLLGV